MMEIEDSEKETLELFKIFILEYSKRNETSFYYRSKLKDHYLKGIKTVQICMEDIVKFNSGLGRTIQVDPFKSLSLLQKACNIVGGEMFNEDLTLDQGYYQVLLTSTKDIKSIRSLIAQNINTTVNISGIAISVSASKPKPIKLGYLCKACRQHSKINPMDMRICSNTVCNSKELVLVPEESIYVDRQYIKLQESPEEVPTGEIPRTITVVCENCLVDRIAPGSRCTIFGIQALQSAGKAKAGVISEINSCMIHALGVQIRSASRNTQITSDIEAVFKDFARRPDIHDVIFRSIAPQIAGAYTKDIKRAIACLLFSGSERFLSDGTKLRGDINVLLIGDPSTAKSQFLKFTQNVAPTGVYTSGKGSSAAGLTAAVLRDSKGEFYVEAGAMVCGDGGVVCIDEFDKMRDQDRVAIHEAMEQQTISIAKAGITTQLSARTSVLAAANPVFGTYDDYHSSAENINFLPTILSRFDLIFILRDIRNTQRDTALAKHILGLHSGNTSKSGHKRTYQGNKRVNLQDTSANAETVDPEFLKEYIRYCKTTCTPTLSETSTELLVNTYVELRNEIGMEKENKNEDNIPITVRQLEAMARIAEALAKMALQQEVQAANIQEAVRLFRACNMTNVQNRTVFTSNKTDSEEIQVIEEFIRSMLPIGSKTPKKKLVGDLVSRRGYNEYNVLKALNVMKARQELKFLFSNRYIQRIC